MINVTKTYLPEKEKYIEYINKIFDSGWITNRGQFVLELEEKLGKLFDVNNLILLSNGTYALQVLYKALNLTGNIITTPFSFVATTSSIVWEGLTPVFADIDPNTYCINPKEIEKRIDSKTSAIVAVHVFGNPCYVEELEYLANKYNIKLIFDAAHAFQVKYNDKSILSYGDGSTLSFHATKIFHTIEGGAIIVKDPEIARRIRLMINFGIEGYDKITDIGINCKMNEFQAAMGLCLLENINERIEKRRKIHTLYLEGFRDNSNIQFQKIQDGTTSLNYSYFPIVLESENKVYELRDMLNKNGINPRRYFYPSLEQLPYCSQNLEMSISSSIANRILCLPVFEDIPNEILNKIISITNSVTQ